MMNFILLIIIGFLELEARGVNNHPAHGPGPPPLIGEIYSIDTSHESHQPAESPTLVLTQQQYQNNEQVQSSSMANNENNFNDIFSSTSSENIEYTDNDNDNDNDKQNSENYNNHDLIADDDMNNQKLIIDNRNRNEQLKQITDDEYALNALKEITPPIKLTMLQAQNNLASLDTTTSGTNIDKNHDKQSTPTVVNTKINNEKLGNCGTYNLKNKIDNYLKLGDQVIQVKLSELNDHTLPPSSLPSITTAKATADAITLHFDVTHDVFQTHKGLLAGIIYKVEIFQPTPHEIIDFLIETTIQQKPFGEFLEQDSSKQTDEMNDSAEMFGWEKQLWNIEKTKFFDKSTNDWNRKSNNNNNNNKNSDTQSTSKSNRNNNNNNINDKDFTKRNNCERHLMFHKFIKNSDENDGKIVLNWTVSNKFNLNNEERLQQTADNSITFRLLYRRRNRRDVYETNLTLIFLRECTLTFKAFSGSLDSSIIPFNHKHCTFHFSLAQQNQYYTKQPPGLLIKLIRLNVPCNEGGYIKFNQTINMCGKLEEIAENQRTLYFRTFNNTALHTFNHPTFKFVYKLVDYCYNITLLEQNSSFVIQPTHSALKCHFKIHMPYGNTIALNLMINDNLKSGRNDSAIDTRHINLNNSNKRKLSMRDDDKYDIFNHDNNYYFNLDNILGVEATESSYCSGILIEIFNRMNDKWVECVNSSSTRILYKLISSENVLFIRVTKRKIRQHSTIPSKIPTFDRTKSVTQNNDKDDDEDSLPLLYLEYSAVPVDSIIAQCAFGWILVGQSCLSIVNEPLSWQNAENNCNHKDGHLVSIRNDNDQNLIDKMIINSPHYNEHGSFWVGATDKYFEGDFRWTDGSSFSFSKWFPGWIQHENYNRQPNDDSTDEQDCVEIRRHFHKPASGLSTSSSLTESFMWNDRDCDTKNFFLCERPLIDEPNSDFDLEDCNKTIHLTRDKMRITFTSPGFPRFYPDNVNCMTFIAAPAGHHILIEFEELVLEHEPQCSYDYLEMFELSLSQTNSTRNARHSSKIKYFQQPLYDMINGFPSLQQQQQLQQHEFQQLHKEYLQQQSQQHQNIFQPSNNTYNIFTPPPNTLSDRMPRRLCGDWSSKLKLLRYKTQNNILGIRFSSDYSHHFGGFKAKISMEKAASECINERLKSFNESCYLFISFPEVQWVVAQQICRSMGAQLSSVSTLDEQRFIISNIRNNMDYSQRSFYWLGAEYSKNSDFEWTDGSKMSFTGWLPGHEKITKPPTDLLCLGLQWKSTPTPMLPSGLYWAYQKCSNVGGYICKQNKKNNVFIQNQTITGIEGRLTSPDYPNQYSPNMNYWVKVSSPEKTRIVVQFQKLDVEDQNECLYDYVSVQDIDFHFDSSTNGNRPKSAKLIDDIRNDYQEDQNFDVEMLDSVQYDDKIKYHINRKRFIHKINKRSATEIETNSVTGLNSPSFQPYVRWCGNHDTDMSQFDFVSKSNEISINFFTDYSQSGEGFSATWRSIDTSACPGQTLTSKEGIITSPNFPHFLLHNLNCSYTIQAAVGRRIWMEFNAFDIVNDAFVHIDLGDGTLLQPYQMSNIISDGVYTSKGEKIKILLRTGTQPQGKGFKVTFRTTNEIIEHRVVNLSNMTFGNVYHLNYPQSMPTHIDFTQHFIAPLGEVISIELQGVQFSENGCENNSSTIEIYDNYADKNGTSWHLCKGEISKDHERKKQSSSVIFITSFLNTIHIRQLSNSNEISLLNATIRVQSDINYKLKLISSTDDWVESCQPNPCQFGGKCMMSGQKQMCQCKGHFTGRFCGLTMCELDPCVFGQCELTNNGFKCQCQSGYLGLTCDQRQKPCNDNPCEGRGECIEKNGGYSCRCHAWWEGAKCEKRMRIPYRPLSERMLQEPFWLGLITVFVVLAVIGLVWCAKRHFPEKIEKLLAEEADRNRPAHLRHHHHISLREQLQVAGAASNPVMPGGPVTTPGAPKSIFGRLGIRKPSLLSLSSPQPPTGSTARTFSLDDLLRPPPRRTPSPRKKRNNSTPTKKNAAEKKQILQQLISPGANHNKVTLGELIQLSENSGHNNLHHNNIIHDAEYNMKETTFNETAGKFSASASTPAFGTGMHTRQMSSDPKLEKKVTFARLLSKMTSDITTGQEFDGNNHSSALSLPTDVQFRASSVPPSPCNNDMRSPHSTSSNQGSDSLSSSELALHDLALRTNRKNRPKVSSADSILAMFKNFASSNAAINLPVSFMISPLSTPTATSPQDEFAGDDESSTSSIHTPVSFSSNAPDSPVFYRTSTIEVPVLDALSAHKSSTNSNMLHPPTILLEIPGNINKCLSPIRELPTPMPSPALTPVMTRPQRITRSPQTQHDETISVTFSDDDDKNNNTNKRLILVDISSEMNRLDSDNESANMNTTSSDSNVSSSSVRRLKLMSMPAVSIDPPSPEVHVKRIVAQRPKNLIIPELIIQTPSPTKERLPVAIFPGSPPPQRASIGETSGMFPNKLQQKRLMMQYEKPGSLDFPFAPPMITITANMSEVESDVDFLSPSTLKVPMIPNKLGVPGSSGMTYLSPFSMCTRGDRAPSEGNLSSSGYSSMASPGPSRCNSNNPLYPHEMDDGNNGSSHPGMNITIPLNRRQTAMLKRNDDSNCKNSSNNDTSDQQEQLRRRSDSETLSDETLLESNDEGIGTDHLDEKIEDGEIKSAKDLEIFIGKEFLENGQILLNPEETITMSQLQLPSIVIQSEFGFEKVSPVSSRSESPLSDRNMGMGRFSPQFYGKKDQQLPIQFTDSDGLYDFPSSDGKGSAGGNVQHRKSAGKRRERRSSKTNLLQSPSKNSIHLEIPAKVIALNSSQSNSSKYHTSNSFARKSPKRRPHRYTPSSSSSTESLTATNNTKDTTIPSIKLRDCLIENIESKQYGNVPEDTEKYGTSNQIQTTNKTQLSEPPKKPPSKKLSRMKAIGNQIRFLRRLEQALKERDRLLSDSCADDGSDVMDSPKASSPLLPSTSSTSNKQKASNFKMSRQKRVSHVYSFEPEREHTLIDKDFLSD